MTQAYEVLGMLIPDGGWTITGEEYEGIQFLECDPITKKQFTEGFAAYNLYKKNKDEATATQKAALLARLGITADEAKLLIG